MKKNWYKLSSVITACLTMVLAINANSSGCHIIHQPKAPKQLNELKRIK